MCFMEIQSVRALNFVKNIVEPIIIGIVIICKTDQLKSVVKNCLVPFEIICWKNPKFRSIFPDLLSSTVALEKIKNVQADAIIINEMI